MGQVQFAAWAMGLNPYNYLQECFGGAPDINGFMQNGPEGKVAMVHPDALILHGSFAQDYLKVSSKHMLRPLIFSTILPGIDGILDRPEGKAQQDS